MAALGGRTARGRKRRIAHGEVVHGTVQARGGSAVPSIPEERRRHQPGLDDVAQAKQPRRGVDDLRSDATIVVVVVVSVVVSVQFPSREAPAKTQRVREQLTRRERRAMPLPPSGVYRLVKTITLAVVLERDLAHAMTIVDGEVEPVYEYRDAAVAFEPFDGRAIRAGEKL